MKNQVVPLVDIKRVFSKRQGEIKIHELISTLGNDAELEHKDLSSSYLINLERLGLIEIPKDGHLTKPDAYDRIIKDPLVQVLIEKLNNSNEEEKGDFNKYYAKGTVFGKQFTQACVLSREKT